MSSTGKERMETATDETKPDIAKKKREEKRGCFNPCRSINMTTNLWTTHVCVSERNTVFWSSRCAPHARSLRRRGDRANLDVRRAARHLRCAGQIGIIHNPAEREREPIIVEEASTMHGWINTPGAQHGQTSKFMFSMKLPVVLPRPADQVSRRDGDSR
jgi:hypothetical protein